MVHFTTIVTIVSTFLAKLRFLYHQTVLFKRYMIVLISSKYVRNILIHLLFIKYCTGKRIIQSALYNYYGIDLQ